MYKKLTIAQWAATHSMSRQAGYQAVHRCKIPVDADGLVDVRVADVLYRERTKPRAKRPRPAPAEPVDLVELAEDIGRIMARDGGALMREGMQHLRCVLAHIPDGELDLVRLPPEVLDELRRELEPTNGAA
jgi:hypothetical protein